MHSCCDVVQQRTWKEVVSLPYRTYTVSLWMKASLERLEHRLKSTWKYAFSELIDWFQLNFRWNVQRAGFHQPGEAVAVCFHVHKHVWKPLLSVPGTQKVNTLTPDSPLTDGNVQSERQRKLPASVQQMLKAPENSFLKTSIRQSMPTEC